MLAMRSEAEISAPKTNPNPELIKETPKVSVYEQCREERIKENLQRMQNLGILNLSRKIKSEMQPVKRKIGHSNSAHRSTPPLQPSRRSSRLENSTPVVYTEGINEKSKKTSSVVLHEGQRPEIYTEEHEKLLGNTEKIWTCFVDGYAKDGKRIYDPIKGKTCHQCRQKTLGYRTCCSQCDMVQGQFCGDCLFMRYGEHVLEALENPNWTCPVCRGICNCSLCRNNKGWVPTGPIYRRIAALGYKSVAHYLVQTKRVQTNDATPNQASAKRSLSFQEAKPNPKSPDDNDDLSGEEPKLQNGDVMKKEEDENMNENPSPVKRSLSFSLPIVDGQTPEVSVHVEGNLEPTKQDKPEDSCTHIGDGLPKTAEQIGQKSNLETKLESYLCPVDNQTPLVDVQVLGYLELPKQDKEETTCSRIGDDNLLKIHGEEGQNSSLEIIPVSYLLPVVSETETRGNNSMRTPVTRRKRKAAVEPNPDSIGGRLRQRRKCQSGL